MLNCFLWKKDTLFHIILFLQDKREIIAHRAPLSMGVPGQEYWRGLPFPSPRDIPDPGIEPASPTSPVLQVDSLLLNHHRSSAYELIDPIISIVSMRDLVSLETVAESRKSVSLRT